MDFYRRRYRPADAVLAVVGDVSAQEVLADVRRRFGDLPGGAPSPPPRTVEPPQRGLRRVELLGKPSSRNRFEIAYRTPAAADHDYPAFLLLRELLGGTGGVNFRQDDTVVPVGAGTRLEGAADDLTTWAPPAAYPYVLTIAGSADPAASRDAVEAAIEARVAALRDQPVPAAELEAARRRLAAQLVFDLETTEDAAHQLAFFEGIGARGVLLRLPELVAAVTADDVQRVAAAYLRPEQRTIGWWLAGQAGQVEEASTAEASVQEPTESEGPAPSAAASEGAGPELHPPTLPVGAAPEPKPPVTLPEVPLAAAETDGQTATAGTGSPTNGGTATAETEPPTGGETAIADAGLPTESASTRIAAPHAFRLPSGLPVIFQRSPLSPTGYLLVVVPTRAYEFPAAAHADPDSPVWRHTGLGFRFLREDFATTVAAARRAVDAAKREQASPPTEDAAGNGEAGEATTDADPESALHAALTRLLHVSRTPGGGPAPVLLAVAGDLDPEAVRHALTESFGDLGPGKLPASPPAHLAAPETTVHLPQLAQAQLGYAVPAPPPYAPDATAWRLLLYIVSHDYEGRLGKEAISRRGLVYYIGSAYACDGQSGWISLEMGVDPGKVAAMRALLAETLAGLTAHPPTDAELAEAKANLLGRRATAAQSNEELTARLAREQVCNGGPVADDAYRRTVEAVRREDLLRILPAFTAGAVATVE